MNGNVKLNFVTNPMATPRLCLVNLTNNGQEPLDWHFCSGHGSTIEFFSMGTATSSPTILCNSIDVFPLTKSLIHEIFPCKQERGTLWILTIAGFECALFTVKINNESGIKHSSLNRLKHWRFNDWIINAKPLDDNKSFFLHSATNSIKLLRFPHIYDGTWGADCTELNVQLDCHAQVTASYIQGNKWDTLRVFAGTNFGAINLFKPANGSRVLGTYNGNTGMPFAIRSSSNWLFSVGDDRSLRVWDHQSRQQLFEKFGHGARAFVLEICESRQLLISGGLDTYLCVWRWTTKIESINDEVMENLILERKMDLGCGALGAVRSILIMDADMKNGNNNIDLLIGSERGALISLSFPLHSRASSNLIPFKMNAFVFIKLDRHNFLLFLDDQRNLVLRRMDSSQNDVKFGLKLVEMGTINRHIQSISDSHGNPKKFRPDLFIYSHNAQALALCSELDLSLHLFIFGISSDNSPYFKCIIIEGPSEQIHWIQPEDSRMLLTVNARGDMIIYQINGDVDNLFLTEFVQLIPPNNDTYHEKWPPRIQCNFMIRSDSSTFESGILLLGTRSGSLLAYSMQSGNCISVYANIHGSLDKNYKFARCGVTAIIFLENPKKIKMKSNLLSMGRDGSLKRWNYRRLENENFYLQLVDIHHLPMEWPCVFFFANDSRLLISGFHSNEFLLMDAKNDTILCNFQCGGGNRSWQLIMDDNGQEFKFVFTQKSLLNYVTLSPMKIHHIRSSIHSDGIVTLAATVFGSNTNTDTVIVTGGLDRRLTLLMTANTEDLNPTDIFPVDSAQIHCSSIEGIYVVDIEKWATFDDVGTCPDDKVILSVGGRTEICVWRLHFGAEEGNTPKLHFLSSHQLVSGDSSTITDDTRLMSVRHLASNLVAILCSDGSIRIVRLPPPLHPNPSLHSPLYYWPIRIPSLAMFRSMEIVQNSDFDSLFAISSSGHLHLFHLFLDQILDDEVPLPNYSLSSFFREQFPPVMVEQCGLSSLALTKYYGTENSNIIFVGSESGRITVLKHDGKGTSPIVFNTSLINDDVQHFELCTIGDWHSSTVTAIQCFATGFLSPSNSSSINVFSVSLDCRLIVGAFNFQQNLLTPFRQFSLGISDPAALLLIRSSIIDHRHNFQLFVSGAGIEHIRLEIENAVEDIFT